MVWGYFGSLLYIGLLLTNAVAILNEERFLARIGWSTRSAATANAGFGHSPNPGYDAFGGGAGGIGGGGDGPGVKAKLVNLISATRTLMRLPLIVVNVVIIVYELLFG